MEILLKNMAELVEDRNEKTVNRIIRALNNDLTTALEGRNDQIRRLETNVRHLQQGQVPVLLFTLTLKSAAIDTNIHHNSLFENQSPVEPSFSFSFGKITNIFNMVENPGIKSDYIYDYQRSEINRTYDSWIFFKKRVFRVIEGDVSFTRIPGDPGLMWGWGYGSKIQNLFWIDDSPHIVPIQNPSTAWTLWIIVPKGISNNTRIQSGVIKVYFSPGLPIDKS